MNPLEILHYLTASGNGPYQLWLDALKDLKGRVAIQRRVDRIQHGNSGDHKFCQDGVWELRIDLRSRVSRVLCARGKNVVLLLCGGSKRNQSADIKDAVNYWRDYKRRKQ